MQTRAVGQSTQWGIVPGRAAAVSLGQAPQPSAVSTNGSNLLLFDESLDGATVPTQVDLLWDWVTGTTRVTRNNGTNPTTTFSEFLMLDRLGVVYIGQS